MAPVESLPDYIREHYEVHEWRHATAVLEADFPLEWQDLIAVLCDFELWRSHVEKPGGRKSKVAEVLDSAFFQRKWEFRRFHTQIVVDGKPSESPTHEVDCYKNGVALEIEWNNKDPFFDRDLNNFRLLFELRVISVGIIITRCDHLQAIFNRLGIGTKYGSSTTHMGKLLPRLEGGGGGGCPVLVFGIKDSLYRDNV